MENPTKEETTGMPRAQSSLELLSQTAIEIESANSSPVMRAPSPARVTPASSVSETLVLPDMVSTTGYQMTLGKDPPQLMPRPDGLSAVSSSLMLRTESSGLMMGRTSSFSDSMMSSSSFQPMDETVWLRQQLAVKDNAIAALQAQVQNLTQEIRQLRQLPTGKISQIPLEYVTIWFGL